METVRSAVVCKWGRLAIRCIGLCLLTTRCFAANSASPPLVNSNAAMMRPLPDCHVGAYLLSDGSIVDIAPDEDGLRWLRFDGTTGRLRKTSSGAWASTLGWTNRGDDKLVSFSDCGMSLIDFDHVLGKRIDLDVRETTFRSHDTALAARLLLPSGGNSVPIVVLVHGSEETTALDFHQFQRFLPAHGVGVFVYDKRGTGRSGGTYTQDFSVLADDVVAATRAARRLAGPRLSRIGYWDGSQGGWVAPLAANRAPIDFVIVAFGLAVSLIDEDQEEIEMEMRGKGHSPAEIAQALRVARAAEAVIASDFTRGFAELGAMRAEYRNAPWYKDLHGNLTYRLLPYSQTKLRELAATELSFARTTPFHYDSMRALRAARVPELWILGGEDYAAPSAETKSRIEALIAASRPFTLAYYPKADHGITLFDTDAKGARVSTRYAPGYFKLICDFARDGRLSGAYGDAKLNPPARL